MLMMRKKIVAANWKMNMTQAEAARFVESFLLELGEISDVEVVIIPPFTAIAKVTEALGKSQNIKVGAQNMHWERAARSPARSARRCCAICLCATSCSDTASAARFLARRTKSSIARCAQRIEATLRPIVCVGETLEQRDKGNVEKILSMQLRGSLAGLRPKELQETVIAYEPVWAIGTGRNATPEQAQEAHAFIRQILGEMSDEPTADKSPHPVRRQRETGQCRELMSQPDIDGALVGGASLDPRSFAQIVKAAREE